MRIHVLLASAITAASPIGAPLAAQLSPAEIIDRAVAAWAKITTVRGTFEQTVSNSLTGTSATSRGSYAQERPNRLAIRFEQPGNDAIVADGKAVWIYLPSSSPGQVIKRAATDRAAVPIDLTGQFLDAPRRKYDVAVAPSRSVGGRPAHGLMLVPKPGISAGFSKATVWVDDEDALIREFEVTEPNGVTRHVRLITVEPNASINRSQFTFAIPKGARVIDQTSPPR